MDYPDCNPFIVLDPAFTVGVWGALAAMIAGLVAAAAWSTTQEPGTENDSAENDSAAKDSENEATLLRAYYEGSHATRWKFFGIKSY
jgi:hypothetical protein